MSTYQDKIGDRLLKYRKSKNYNIVQFANFAGISHGSMSSLENNKSKPSADTLANLCRHTDINIIWLLAGEGQMTTSGIPKTQELSFSDPKSLELLEVITFILNSGDSKFIKKLEILVQDYKEIESLKKQIEGFKS